MINDYFNLAWKNLRKRKLRSWLTIIGIIISVATIFMLISISVGLRGAIAEQFRMLGTDKIFIQPKGQAGAPGAGGAVLLTEEDVKAIENVAGVKAVSYLVAGNAKIELGSSVRYYMVAAFPKENVNLFFEAGGFEVDEGKPLTSTGSIKLGEVAVGSLYKTGNLFKRPVKVGDTLKINEVDVKVVTIMKPVGNPQDDQNIYMFLDTYEEIYGKTDRADMIYVQIDAGEDIKLVSDRIERRLLQFRGLDKKTEDFTILTPEELLSSFDTILNIITAFLAGIAAISLLVGSIGISNTMFTSVLERTKEIGTMKAVGAKNSDILLIFLIEAGLLGLVGGILGVGLGYAGAKTIEIIATQSLGTNLLKAASPLWLIGSCLSFAFIIGCVSGVWPAYRAAKLKAVDALRYE